jgi:hypothetical protein
LCCCTCGDGEMPERRRKNPEWLRWRTRIAISVKGSGSLAAGGGVKSIRYQRRVSWTRRLCMWFLDLRLSLRQESRALVQTIDHYRKTSKLATFGT